MKKQLFQKFNDLWDLFGGVREVATNISPLLDLWQCTRRNVNLILTRLQEEKCIEWKPEHGRGKQSMLYFLKTPQEIRLEAAVGSANAGDLESAFQMVNSLEDKRALLEILERNLGFQNIEKEGDALRIPYYRPLETLDPIHTTRVPEAHLIHQIFDNLVRYDHQTQKIVPHLAHAWKVKNDGKRWTFYLRKHVYFHHNRKMTSADVKDTLQSLIDDHSGFQPLFQNITGLHCDSDHQITIDLKYHHHLFLHLLTGSYAVIVPQERRKFPEFAKIPIGTGPFKVVKNNEYHLVLKAFPQYFDLAPLLETVEIWFFENRDVLLQRDLNMLWMDQQGEKDNQSDKSTHHKGYFHLLCNTNKPGPLQSLEVREYLRQALSSQKVAEALKKGKAAYTIMPEWGEFPLDPVVPQALPPGTKLNLVTFRRSNNDDVYIQKELEALGIEVNLIVVSYDNFRSSETLNNADLVYYGEMVANNVALALYEYFGSNTSPLRSFLDAAHLKHIDQQIQAILQAPDSVEQFRRFRELSQYTVQERVIFPLYHMRVKKITREDLQGIHLGNFGWMPFKELWLAAPDSAS